MLDFSGKKQDLGKDAGKDAKANKSTFVSRLGEEETRQKAEMLVKQAIEHLHPFEKAQVVVLKELAEYLLDRKS